MQERGVPTIRGCENQPGIFVWVTQRAVSFFLNHGYILLGVIRFLTKNCVTDYDCKREHGISLFSGGKLSPRGVK